ncbi:MAG TPA: hypothetical protein DER70_12105, partial [Lentisphaeria bacterium]|nr:hypothetical protein [Lentisphaeria bacterium]
NSREDPKLIYIHLSDITSSFFVRLPFTLFVWTPDADQVKPGLRLLGAAPNNKGHLFCRDTQKKNRELFTGE